MSRTSEQCRDLESGAAGAQPGALTQLSSRSCLGHSLDPVSSISPICNLSCPAASPVPGLHQCGLRTGSWGSTYGPSCDLRQGHSSHSPCGPQSEPLCGSVTLSWGFPGRCGPPYSLSSPSIQALRAWSFSLPRSLNGKPGPNVLLLQGWIHWSRGRWALSLWLPSS